jgi:exopolyphosphatase/guanosine-5'-triphosphate,3'-diphosphate pyrophosphatase
MRVASIDIGTNTVLLLIADVERDDLQMLVDDHATARLGEGVDKTGVISDAAYERLRSKLLQHAITIDHFAPLTVSAIATSAMRDARNRDEILRRAKDDTGIAIEVISGDEEARWTYLGAIQALQLPDVPIAVVDIGGGSTELALGDRRSFDHGVSAQIGAVRLTERAHEQNLSVDDAAAMVRDAFGAVAMPPDSDLIAVAGTPTTLAAIELGLAAFDASRIHGHRLSLTAVNQVLDNIWDMPSEEIVTEYAGVNPGRADILAAGTLILREAMQLAQVRECIVSTRGLRYGIALRAAKRG